MSRKDRGMLGGRSKRPAGGQRLRSFLAVLLTVAMVLQSSNVTTIAEELLDASDEVAIELVAEDEATAEAASEEDEATDEAASEEDASDEEAVVEDEEVDSEEAQADEDTEETTAETEVTTANEETGVTALLAAANVPSVTASTSYGDVTVYLYVKVAGNTDGLTLNSSGWYTVGKITLTDVLPSASSILVTNYGSYTYGQDYLDAVVSAVKSGSYEAYATNATVITKSMVEDVVDWTYYGLNISNGADDYSDEAPERTNAWHLDGYIKIQYKLILDHYVEVDEGTSGAIQYSGKYYKLYSEGFYAYDDDDLNTTVESSSLSVDIDGYTYSGADPESTTLTSKGGTVKLYYDKAYTGSVSLDDWTYGDDAKTETLTDPTGGDYGSATLEYKVAGADDSTYTYTKPTDAGTYTVKATWTSNTHSAITATDDFTITPRPITLTGNSASVAYTGSEQSVTGYTITSGSLASGDAISSAEASAKGTNPGTHTGTITPASSVTIAGSDGSDVTANYTITTEPGTLTITTGDISAYVTLETQDVEKVYDGTELESGTATATDANDNAVTVEYSADGETWTTDPSEITRTDAGVTTVQVRASAPDYYDGYVYGTQTITVTKRSVTLTSATDSKEYDGTALTNGTVTVSGDGFVDGEGATYDVTGSQTLVGSSSNAFTYELNNGTKADNYTITTAEGTLTVTSRVTKYEVTLVANSGEYTYDGTEHSTSGIVTDTFEVDGNTYTVSGYATEDPSETNAGTYTNNITGTFKVTDAEGNDVTSEFSVSTQNGTLVINKRSITVTTESAAKVYDGSELTADGTIEGLVEGDATFSVTGSQTAVGSSTNTYDLSWAEDKADNYDLTESLGTLTVTTQSIDPDDPNNYLGAKVDCPEDHVYDGEEHQWSPTVTDKDGNILTEGTDYTVSYDTDNFTDVTGTITVTITGIGNYSGEVTRTYQITPRTYTVETPSASKTYDGEALTASGTVAECIDGLVAGETVSFATTGSQTLVGSSENTYELSFDGTAKESNYVFDGATLGTLTVTDGTDDDPVDPDDVVTKTHDGGEYGLDDVVTFTITVTNIYDEVKTITLSELDGVTLEQSVFEDVQPGETVTTSATYTITEDDILAGSFVNTVSASFSGGKTFENDDEVKTEDPNGHLTVTKAVTSAPADGEKYALGEVITWTVTITNTGNQTLTGIEVVDQLDGTTLADGQSATIESLAPGETVTLDYSYTVTESDLGSTIVNTVVATASDGTTGTGTSDGVSVAEKATENVAATSTTSKASANEQLPTTGDSTMNVLYIAILGAAFIVASGAYKLRCHRRSRQ